MDKYHDYIEALRNKDEEAFAYIYNDTKNSVYAMIISVIKDRSLAEDVMQDTYIKMISSINSYKYSMNFRNWLLTIAKNTAIDYYRKRKHDVIIDVGEDEYLLGHTDSNNLSKLQSDELLSILTDEERQIVLLRIVDDIKHKDIAKIVNKPLGTVLWIYNKAIKKMKNYSRR